MVRYSYSINGNPFLASLDYGSGDSVDYSYDVIIRKYKRPRYLIEAIIFNMIYLNYFLNKVIFNGMVMRK